MRKHFLILMLLTLLPLAMWADTDVKVYAKNVPVTFGVATPAVSSDWFDLSGSNDPEVIDAVATTLTYQTQRTVSSPVVDGGYDFSLYKTQNVVHVGTEDYYISIADANAKLLVQKNTADLGYVYGELAAVGSNTYSETNGTPDDKTLFSGAPVVTIGAADISDEVVYALAADAETWTSDITTLKANQAGSYTLYFKVAGTTSHEALDPHAFPGGSIDLAVNTIVPPIAGQNFTYNGATHPLAEAPITAPTFGVIEYSLDEISWSEDIPTAINVNDPNQVYWRVQETTNYTGQASTALDAVTITPATPVITVPAGIQDNWTWEEGVQKPLVKGAAETTFGTIKYAYKFQPKNGAYDEYWSDEKTGWDFHKASQAGHYRLKIEVKADTEHGNWTVASYKPNGSFPVITVDLAPATVEVGSEPQAIDGLVYTGDDQPLVTAGTGIGGEMQYSLDGVTYNAAIPEGQDAGDYNVYYKVVGNENHSDLVVAQPVDVNIATAAATLGVYAAVEDLVYNGGDQTLLSETTAPVNGEARFSFDGGETWSADATLPTGKDATTYSILYKVDAIGNYHSVVAENPIPVTIDKKAIDIYGAEGEPALEYNAQDQDLLAKTAAYTGAIGAETAVTFAYTINGVEATELKAKNAGTYTVAWTAILNPSNNYKTSDATSGSVEVNIAKKSIGYLLGNKDWTYNGQQATTDGTYAVMAGSFPAGKTLANENIKFEFPGEVINVKEGGYTFGSLTPAKLNEEGDDNRDNYSFIFAGNSTVNVLPAAFEPKDEDITFEPATATFAAENITVVPAIAGMTEGEDYTYTVAPATINNAGEYTFTFTGKGNYTDATATKVFTVAQKNIAADMVQGEGIFDAVAYDGQNHAVAIALKWAKNPEATTEAGKKYVNLVEGTDFDVYVNGVKTLSTEVEAINAGDYEYTIKGIGNYAAQLDGEDYTLTINRNDDPEDFAGAFSFTEDTWTEKVYNAASQTPAWSTTLADADYDILVESDGHVLAGTKADALALKLKNKGTYTYYFTPKGNYTGETFDKEFTITPATIAVQAANATKEYNGLDGLAGADGGQLTYSGIKAPDTEAVVIAPENPISVVPVDEQTKNVGEYNLTVNVDDFDSENGNYEFVAANQQGKLTIAKKTGVMIAFTAETKKAYGVADEDADLKANLTVAGEIEGEEEDMLADITVTRREGAAYEGENVGKYVNALQINLDEDALPFSNYAITYAQNYGTLVIDAPDAIVIALKDETKFNKEYDGKAPADWVVSAEDLIVSGGLANPEPLDPSIITKLPTAKVQNASANVGTYVIKLEGAETTNYPVVAIDGKMVISAKKLAKGSVSIQEQTLQAGTSIDNFATDAYEVKNLVGDEDYTAIWGIKLTDAHKADGKVAGTTDEAGIQLYVIDEVAAANYEFDAAEKLAGRLVVPSATSIFLTRGDRATQSIEDGANNIFTGNKNHTNVEFDSFAMDAKKWYAMVLPFDANMSQFIQAFGGYVAVDVLDKSNTNTSKMNFELNGATVPAHTPFLIKLFEPTNLNTVKFVDVNVEETKGANTTLTDAANNELIGTYAGKKFNGDNENCWILSLNSGKWQAASATATVYPLGAYIHTATANARIFVQEEDGTVTEIEGINADGSAVEAGTYYTVNGMKLDKAPTKKGVYVKDGKKVVVK